MSRGPEELAAQPGAHLSTLMPALTSARTGPFALARTGATARTDGPSVPV